MAETKFKLDLAALEQAVRAAAPAELLKIGNAIATEAKRLAPVDTGRLRSSITADPDGDDVIVGSSVEYAAFVEFGTSRNTAQPFLQPAIYKVAARVAKKRGR